jgi:acyl-CoA thioester hydrolase
MPHITNLEIRFADIDKMGHVNNAKYLTYFEQARMCYFEKVVGEKFDWSEEGIILAKAEIDFIFPLKLEHKIQIQTKCTKLGNKSFDLEYIVNTIDQQVAAKGKTIMVCYNYKLGQTIPIPTLWREKFLDFEREG